jgi:hypothetical protein
MDVANTANTFRNVVFGMLIILIIMVVVWAYNKTTLRKRNCDTMDSLYTDFAKVRTVNTDNDAYSYNLRDYYIKTAYNACSAGQFKNDFVDTCALKNCIRQGIRCLDFEIYSVNNMPVIATSSVDDYSVKETYNSVPFADVLAVIRDYGFSGGTSPNPGDPIIIHLRIMSKNAPIYKTIADNLETTFTTRLLGPNFSYENQGKNLGIVSLKDLMGKVIIIADKSEGIFESTELDEYVNIASNSIFMRALRYSEGVKYTPDMQELIEYNKKCMSICLPDISAYNTNPSAPLAMKCGCQMVAMCTQNFDENKEYNDMFFDEVGTAFVLKPAELRYIPVTIPAPTPPPASHSYKERPVSTDYYKFTI